MTKTCERCGATFARKQYTGRQQPPSEFLKKRFCSQTCRLAVLNRERVAAPVAHPWRETDELPLAKQISAHRRAIWICGLDPEDVAQDVRLSLIRRPIPDHLSPATRVWNLRNRIIDVLKRHTTVDLPNGARSGRHRFHRHMVALTPRTPEPGTPHPEPDPWLWRAVDALTPLERDVVTRYFWKDADLASIGTQYGKTAAWACWVKGRALRALRASMGVRA